MTRARRAVLDISHGRVFTALVVDVVRDRCAVRLAENGQVLHGLKYSGGPLASGDACLISYQSGEPVVMGMGRSSLAGGERSPIKVKTVVGDVPRTQQGGGVVPPHGHAFVRIFRPVGVDGGADEYFYPPTSDGLAEAVAALQAGDTLIMPEMQIDGDVTLPAGTKIIGSSQHTSVLGGGLVLGESCTATSLQVYLVEATADDLIGITGPDSGGALLTEVIVKAINTGMGNAYALQIGAGWVRSQDTYFRAQAADAGAEAICLYSPTPDGGDGCRFNQCIYDCTGNLEDGADANWEIGKNLLSGIPIYGCSWPDGYDALGFGYGRGDLAARDSLANPDAHASDLEAGTPVQHLPDDATSHQLAVWDGSKWVSTSPEGLVWGGPQSLFMDTKANIEAAYTTEGMIAASTDEHKLGFRDDVSWNWGKPHDAVTVAGAPLTLSGQQITFNYDSADFQLSGNNLQVKDSGIDHGSIGGLTDDDHAQYAIVAPGSSTRNIVQPSGNHIPLTIRANASQTANLFVIEDSSGTDYAACDALGRWGMGTAPSTTKRLYVYGTDLTYILHSYGSSTATSGVQASLYGQIIANPSAASAGVYIGCLFGGEVAAGNTYNITGALRGLSGTCSMKGEGTLTGLRVFQCQGGITADSADGVISYLSYFYAQAGFNNSTGTGSIGQFTLFDGTAGISGISRVTSAYGMYLGNISAGTSYNYAIYTNAGLVHFGDSIDLASGKNITLSGGNLVTDISTGTKIGTAATQKLALWNATPIAQPSGANQAALTNSTGGSYDGTLADVTSSFNQSILNNNFTDLHTLLNEIRTALVNTGIMKGSA